MIKRIINRLIVESNLELNWGRPIIARWVREHLAGCAAGSRVRVLDVGCAWGADLLNVRAQADVQGFTVDLHGIEGNPELAAQARGNGISIHTINIEQDIFPLADRSVDILIINQVVEHTKEIFWLFAEIGRVLKNGGLLVVGVPNVAAWHERVFILLGRQPRAIKLYGPHIRGITKSGFINFIETGGFYRVTQVRGGNVYGLPAFLTRVAGVLLPTLCVSLFFKIVRSEKTGSFIEVLGLRTFETNYYTGPLKKTTARRASTPAKTKKKSRQ